MLPASALNVAVRLSKELLRRHAARIKGDKALIDAQISSAWVTTLRHDTCGIAPFKSDTESDYSELLVVGVRLHAHTTPAQISRLQQIIHIAVQYPLLLVMEAGETVHLSIRPQGKSVDFLVRACLDTPQQGLQIYVSWQQGLPHLMALFNRWVCAVHALALTQCKSPLFPPLSFVPQESPQQAAALAQNLHKLQQDWQKVSCELRAANNPRQRISLAKERRRLSVQTQQLLKNHKLLS